MEIWFLGKKIQVNQHDCQLMADCLVQWRAGEWDPDEEDDAKELRDNLLKSLTWLMEGEDGLA